MCCIFLHFSEMHTCRPAGHITSRTGKKSGITPSLTCFSTARSKGQECFLKQNMLSLVLSETSFTLPRITRVMRGSVKLVSDKTSDNMFCFKKHSCPFDLAVEKQVNEGVIPDFFPVLEVICPAGRHVCISEK